MAQAYADLTPRAASLIAALHAAKGDKEAAGVWLLELIAWIAFDAQRRPPAPCPAERRSPIVVEPDQPILEATPGSRRR